MVSASIGFNPYTRKALTGIVTVIVIAVLPDSPDDKAVEELAALEFVNELYVCKLD